MSTYLSRGSRRRSSWLTKALLSSIVVLHQKQAAVNARGFLVRASPKKVAAAHLQAVENAKLAMAKQAARYDSRY